MTNPTETFWKLNESHLTAHGSNFYTADASDFGWPPGYFPSQIHTTLGNGLTFYVTHQTERNDELLCVHYQQRGGSPLTLTILND